MFNLFKKPKCPLCGQEAKDNLRTEGTRRRQPYCRQHLVEEFNRRFLSTPFRMVICHPNFDNICSALYGYYPVEEMKGFDFPEKDVARTQQLLEGLQTHPQCQGCGGNAQVTYFDPSCWNSLYQQTGTFIKETTGPFLSDLPNSGKYLCIKCGLKQIKGAILRNKDNFIEGLWVPYKSDGIYVSTYL